MISGVRCDDSPPGAVSTKVVGESLANVPCCPKHGPVYVPTIDDFTVRIPGEDVAYCSRCLVERLDGLGISRIVFRDGIRRTVETTHADGSKTTASSLELKK